MREKDQASNGFPTWPQNEKTQSAVGWQLPGTVGQTGTSPAKSHGCLSWLCLHGKGAAEGGGNQPCRGYEGSPRAHGSSSLLFLPRVKLVPRELVAVKVPKVPAVSPVPPALLALLVLL